MLCEQLEIAPKSKRNGHALESTLPNHAAPQQPWEFKEPGHLQFALKLYMWQEPKLDTQAPMAPGNNLGTNLYSLDR